ncbi:S-adenosyl-L-methionine-dependent methyltransferase [Blastocladiella britannica]|nr:S-adenosyl-L-methionine-dependent methyltransferase [Blastocladiella britannica]
MSAPSTTAIDGDVSPPLRVLEFYSGIGGMHYSLKRAGVNANVLAAFEINDAANAVYRHNFKGAKVVQGLIEGLPAAQFDTYNADIWTMSPPCQPFSRQLHSKQEGLEDARSRSFLHILAVLRALTNKPSYILVENVKGFDESTARDSLVETLTELDYSVREFLLTPSQYGIPNSRLRYYLVARLDNAFHTAVPTTAQAVRGGEAPSKPSETPSSNGDEEVEEKLGGAKPAAPVVLAPVGVYTSIPGIADVPASETRPIRDFLLPNSPGVQAWKDVEVWKRTPLFDIVTPSSTRSCCFTKNYARYVEGTGSVLQENDQLVIQDIWPTFLERQPLALAQIAEKQPVTSVQNPLLSLRLRHFDPREVANLMSFPPGPEFTFPNHITRKQRFQLLGNSINVHVVAKVMQFMLNPES